jgi:hypothetical protein
MLPADADPVVAAPEAPPEGEDPQPASSAAAATHGVSFVTTLRRIVGSSPAGRVGDGRRMRADGDIIDGIRKNLIPSDCCIRINGVIVDTSP